MSGTGSWTQTYVSAAGEAYWADVATDSQGNVYVTGGEKAGAFEDLIVRKYDAAGAVVWSHSVNGAAGGYDGGLAIAIDAFDDVFVAGYVGNLGTSDDTFLRKYDGATGATIWTLEHDGGAGMADLADGIAVDSAGDVFVAGAVYGVTQSFDVWYAKVAGDTGALIYEASVNGPANGPDWAYDIDVDAAGNFVVVGQIHQVLANNDVWVGAFHDNGTSVSPLWNMVYAGAGGDMDLGLSVAFDAAGDVLVSGTEYVGGQNNNVWIRKYDIAGNTVWTATHDSAVSGADMAYGVAVDATGDLVVAGHEGDANMSTDIWVRRYDSDGAPLWTATHGGAANGFDVGYAVAIDPAGNVYVAGFETATEQLRTAWLRKYAP